VARPSKAVLDYLAGEAARRYGPIEDDLPARLRRNLKRNLGVVLPEPEVAELLRHYKAVYDLAARSLRDCLKPPAGPTASPGDVDFERLLATLARAYPREASGRLGQIVNTAIYYEYLR
jgi:hypothetical protein